MFTNAFGFRKKIGSGPRDDHFPAYETGCSHARAYIEYIVTTHYEDLYGVQYLLSLGGD
jgi:hypothetical protein